MILRELMISRRQLTSEIFWRIHRCIKKPKQVINFESKEITKAAALDVVAFWSACTCSLGPPSQKPLRFANASELPSTSLPQPATPNKPISDISGHRIRPRAMTNMMPVARMYLAGSGARMVRSTARSLSTTTPFRNQGPGTGENSHQANGPLPPKQTPNVSLTDEIKTDAMGARDAPLQEMEPEAEKQRELQAPNRSGVWSRNQQPRELAMTGPRFEQTIMETQVRAHLNKKWGCEAHESISHDRSQPSSSFTNSPSGGWKGGLLPVTAVEGHWVIPRSSSTSTSHKSASAHIVVCHMYDPPAVVSSCSNLA
jgi:hypothetical protein